MERGTGKLKGLWECCQRNVVRKSKALLELNLSKDVNNNKGFFKYIIRRRNIRQNVDLLVNDVSDFVTENREKARLTESLLCFSLYC